MYGLQHVPNLPALSPKKLAAETLPHSETGKTGVGKDPGASERYHQNPVSHIRNPKPEARKRRKFQMVPCP
jgi:hypothetical protein